MYMVDVTVSGVMKVWVQISISISLNFVENFFDDLFEDPTVVRKSFTLQHFTKLHVDRQI